ncbi:hypothetical protein TURU_096528 [Turdus rufiventris]|nr:hypothetical protein TURU_096528 [Turdus rufiventris]
MLSPGETASRVLNPVLGFQVQEKLGHTGMNLVPNEDWSVPCERQEAVPGFHCDGRFCRLRILTSYYLTCEKVTMDCYLDRLGKHMEKNSAITKPLYPDILYPDRDLSEYEKIIS